MGWLNNEFSIECPFFGTITSNDDQSLYHRYIHFTPADREIELYIESNSFGPSEQQYILFKDIEQLYPQYIQSLPELMEPVFRKERPGFKITDFSREFRLLGLRIQRFDKMPFCWDMDFETIHRTDGWITVEYIKKEPKTAYFNE